MKKFLSLIIGASFLFSATFANAYNFVNLGNKEFYYGTIFGELETNNGGKKSIFLLKEKDGTIHQLFSTQLAREIESLFKGKNNVKILGQSYENPNNKKYAGVFVNKIWNLDIPETIKKVKEQKIISEDEKLLIYYYLVGNNSKNKFTEGKKIFGNLDLNSIYKEMDNKAENGEINSDLLALIKNISSDDNLYSKSDFYKNLVKTTEEFKSLDKNFLGKIQEIGSNGVYEIFSKLVGIQVAELSGEYLKSNYGIDLSERIKPLSNSEKYILNELFSIDGYLHFLFKKVSAKSAENYEIYNFTNLTTDKNKNERIKFLFKNIKNLELILSQKEENETISDFSEKIKNKIIFTEICKNLKVNKNLHQIKSAKKVKQFLSENKTEEILKTAISKDFVSQDFLDFKIYFPQNFDYQEIKIGNEIFSRIYLKTFYSNILSFNFNKVDNFTKVDGEKSQIKLAGNYGEKIISDGKIFFQIKNNSGEKFEISYLANEKNFQEIFEKILNRIGN